MIRMKRKELKLSLLADIVVLITCVQNLKFYKYFNVFKMQNHLKIRLLVYKEWIIWYYILYYNQIESYLK